MIEKSTTNPPGILPTEVIADFVRFSSFRMELLEKKSSPPLRLSPRRSQKANQRARSDLVSEFSSIYIGFLYASYPIGTGFCSSLVLYITQLYCGMKQVNTSENHVTCQCTMMSCTR